MNEWTCTGCSHCKSEMKTKTWICLNQSELGFLKTGENWWTKLRSETSVPIQTLTQTNLQLLAKNQRPRPSNALFSRDGSSMIGGCSHVHMLMCPWNVGYHLVWQPCFQWCVCAIERESPVKPSVGRSWGWKSKWTLFTVQMISARRLAGPWLLRKGERRFFVLGPALLQTHYWPSHLRTL